MAKHDYQSDYNHILQERIKSYDEVMKTQEEMIKLLKERIKVLENEILQNNLVK